MSVRDCGPNVRMCFKSYVRRNNNGDDSHTETRDCGDPNSGRCFQDTGCSGPGSNKVCCCAGDLCNSSPKTAAAFTLISIFVARIFCF
ncbi:unnamed protein product, partial [Mesorhabditis belari]|uniref:Uncharacterized protein n=1 Tax=Mesorhabditis belari TaxID=2138241 RepID=A0AAF3FQ86_9BILA